MAASYPSKKFHWSFDALDAAKTALIDEVCTPQGLFLGGTMHQVWPLAVWGAYEVADFDPVSIQSADR